MCGIAGFVNDMPIDVKCPVLQRMTDMIAHRGPDSEGHYIDEHAALGHRRLSIIDLGGGQQPIYNEDGSKVITFNGEIYNYQTLREELIAAGHTFTTKSDTEVLLHGYEQWGVDLLQRVRGMFTFVIWDKNKQELFGARDHFGIKPFYYAKMNGTFMYASEIKSLLRHPDFVKELNAEALKPYMTFQYPAIGETFFKGVYKLPEGHYFTYRDGKMDIHRYYDEDFREGKQKLGELVNSIDQTVCDSVKAHQIADVEVGSFLSSGVDSSYVAAVARPQHTYSIGFGKGTYNESQQAGELAELLKLNNTAESLTDEEAFAAFPRIQWHLDEPDSNPSCVPLYFLSALAAKDVKVVLSGEGADEVFGGYLYFHKAPDARAFHEETVRKLSKLHLYDCLRANKSLSAWGVEGRVPFLDKEFLDVAMRLNPESKMCPGKTIEKRIVREAFADMLPESVAWRQKEQFSDGVGYSWIDTLKEVTAADVTDEQMAHAAERFPINPPQNKEEYYYRTIFEGYFPSDSAARSVPSVPSVACSTAEALAWDASFRGVNDPSGRAVAGVHDDAYTKEHTEKANTI